HRHPHYVPTPRSSDPVGGTTKGPHTQAIIFASTPPTPVFPGDTYDVSATGGGSGNPVTFSIDSQSASVCSIAGATVTFNQAGSCVIDANQAGNAQYHPAPQPLHTINVTNTYTTSHSIT